MLLVYKMQYICLIVLYDSIVCHRISFRQMGMYTKTEMRTISQTAYTAYPWSE